MEENTESPPGARVSQGEALVILEECKTLLAKFEAGRVVQELTAQEGELLERFHRVEEAGWVGDAAWDDTVRMSAGLRKSEVGDLSYAYSLLLQRRDPAGTIEKLRVYFAPQRGRDEGRDRANEGSHNLEV